jgi:hypothetical protein
MHSFVLAHDLDCGQSVFFKMGTLAIYEHIFGDGVAMSNHMLPGFNKK